MDKESFLISLFSNDFIGDDGAVIGDWVYSKDLFCEDIHFKREWMSLKEISTKAMLVNISDAIVMNAKPKYALLGLKLPSSMSTKQMKELSSGFLEVSKKYGITIIGGDTVSGDKIDISVTLISHTTNPIKRKGLEVGDLLCFTGELGTVKKDLEILLNGGKIEKNSKFITPILRNSFFYEASPYIKVAMDISDGLSKDISRLSKINSLGFEFLVELSHNQLCSGEEYEIVFGCKEKEFAKIQQIAKKRNTPLTAFAKAVSGSYENICGENHF